MKYYCSTGTFIGRINGRNHRLIIDYGPYIDCDGFEFMMMDTWYDSIECILDDVRASGLSFPVFHADKRTGDMISSLPDDEFAQCVELWKKNMDYAARLGSKKTVCHIWGRPDSDEDPMRIFERVQSLRQISRSFGIDLLSENNACWYGSPLDHLYDYVNLDPSFGVIIDTRAAQFHRELETICRCDAIWNNIRHIHISDMHGDYKQWGAMYPIYAPGQGDIDFRRFFASLAKHGYDGTITLESPAALPDRVDCETLNSFLAYIREGVDGARAALGAE